MDCRADYATQAYLTIRMDLAVKIGHLLEADNLPVGNRMVVWYGKINELIQVLEIKHST